MEENHQNKQGGGKGILIIIAIVILAAAAYFIVQDVNKKDKGNQPTVSISEADRLELSSLNLQGMWNKTVGSDRYELNFKSTKELVLTQYDKNGEVAVKSDEGTYSVEEGVLNMTVAANGQTSTATATAVLSDKYLIITVTEGSEIFAGTYTADREDMPEVDNSGTTESTAVSDNDVSTPESTASEPESTVSTPAGVDNSVYRHLSSNVTDLFGMTPQELINASSTPPDYTIEGINVRINGFKITFGISNGLNDEYGNWLPTENSELAWIKLPCELFFSYPADDTHGEIKGKKVYFYEELEAIYGNDLSNYYVEPGVDIGGYRISAEIDGCYMMFVPDQYSYTFEALDEPITYCYFGFME